MMGIFNRHHSSRSEAEILMKDHFKNFKFSPPVSCIPIQKYWQVPYIQLMQLTFWRTFSMNLELIHSKPKNSWWFRSQRRTKCVFPWRLSWADSPVCIMWSGLLALSLLPVGPHNWNTHTHTHICTLGNQLCSKQLLHIMSANNTSTLFSLSTKSEFF